uniref:Olfactory receptor n=1 Tax=Pyxicephalus adspersus TaxID=30357 RepID=A0AAV3AEM3_PYXAD|nr:TPA: hypothetical protein GDO54_005834 [Pyxicephalus adspersus]
MNETRITTIHLLGFQTHQIINCLIFIFLFLIYCVTICGNLLIIKLVAYSKSLHSPMYFFLTQLAVSDILMATDIGPNSFHVLMFKETIIPFSGCMAQFFFFAVVETVECCLLTVMSYDRYLAICKPLHYTLIMSHHFCWLLVAICWILCIILTLIYTINIIKLQFCGPNVIDHYYCDLDPILQLSCSDVTIVQQGLRLFSALFLMFLFFVMIVSYIYIITAIFKIPSDLSKQKAFSTCSSHLIVVCTYFTSLICVYVVPSRRESANISKFLSLLYTAGNPLMNPIIYSLRNNDLRQVVRKLINKLISLHYNRN